MNLGIYLEEVGEGEILQHAVGNINDGIEKGLLTDASIFYDSIGFNPYETKCGFFNSTDLWNFTGNLITTSIETTRTTLNIVNKFKILFYYNWSSHKDILGLISIVANPAVDTICNNSHNAQELYRLTGIKPMGIVDNFNINDISQVVQV